jgi:transposase
MYLFDKTHLSSIPTQIVPKRVVLHPHLTPQDLKHQYLTRPDRVEARRCHLLWLVATDLNIKDAARVVGFSYDYAKDLVRNYNANGVAAIRNLRRDRHPPGRIPLLNQEQILALQTALQHPPAGGGDWTGAKVANWMTENTDLTGVKYQRGWDYLRRLQSPPIHPPNSD